MNVQHSTSNVQHRMKEKDERPTSNVQRSTFNVQHRMKGQKVKKPAYDLEERLLEYSVRIIKIVEQLPKTRTGNHIAGQLLRSGTSPYPNHGEAQVAESSKDFVHKLRISLKNSGNRKDG